ncbi:hypothetical protein D3C87_1930460 [compost metagenome]
MPLEDFGTLMQGAVGHVVEGEGNERNVGRNIERFRRKAPDKTIGQPVDEAVGLLQKLMHRRRPLFW